MSNSPSEMANMRACGCERDTSVRGSSETGFTLVRHAKPYVSVLISWIYYANMYLRQVNSNDLNEVNVALHRGGSLEISRASTVRFVIIFSKYCHRICVNV